MKEIGEFFVALWPMLKADGSFLFLILVMTCCAGLLWWGGRTRKDDRIEVQRVLDEIRKQIREMQIVTDLLVELHCKLHPDQAIHFRRRLKEEKELPKNGG